MLPGLFLSVSKNIHICPFLSKLDKDTKANTLSSLSFYLSSLCPLSCHHLIKLKFLKINHNFSPSDTNPTIRKALLQSLPKKDIININDPDHTVRTHAILLSPPRIELLDHLNDQNVDVRLAVLNKLSDHTFLKRINRNKQQKIFLEICLLINDIEVSVRQVVSDIIKRFTKVSSEQIQSLLCKADENMKIKPGTFVHGLEDENEIVRINIINSMSTLIKTNEEANTVFDFLLDALNDVIEEVKETAGSNIYHLVKMFRIDVNCEMIDIIFFNFEEKNVDVKDYLFSAIPYLVYDSATLQHTFSRFVRLLDKNVDKERIFGCVKNLVIENVKYFRKYIDGNKVFERRREPPLNDNTHYLHVIVLAEVRKKGNDFKIKEYLKKHLFYYELKDAKIYRSMSNGVERNIDCIKQVHNNMNKANDDGSEYNQIALQINEHRNTSDKKMDKHRNTSDNTKIDKHRNTSDILKLDKHRNTSDILKLDKHRNTSDNTKLDGTRENQNISTNAKQNHVDKSKQNDGTEDINNESICYDRTSDRSHSSKNKSATNNPPTRTAEIDKRTQNVVDPNCEINGKMHCTNQITDVQMIQQTVKDGSLNRSDYTNANDTGEEIKRQKVNNKRDLRFFMCQILKEPITNTRRLLQYKSLFRTKFAKTDLDRFLVRLYNAITRSLVDKDDSAYKRLQVIYGFDVKIDYLYSYIFTLIEVKENTFYISCPTRVHKKFLLPIRLSIRAFYTSEISDTYIKVIGNDFTSYYALRRETFIHVYEEVSHLKVSIIKKTEEGDIPLTKATKVEIV